MNLKNKKFNFLAVSLLVSVLLATNVSAATTLPAGAVPTQKSGIVFGSDAYEYNQGAVAKATDGTVGVCIQTYSKTGVFDPALVGVGIQAGGSSPSTVFNILDANGNRVKSTAVGAAAQAAMYETGTANPGSSGCYGTIVDSQKNFYTFGAINDGTRKAGLVTKLDSAGNILWEKIIGKIPNTTSTFSTAVFRAGFDAAGDIIIGGESNISETTEFTEVGNGDYDIFVAKISKTDGSYIVKPKTYGGSDVDRYAISGRDVYQSHFVTDAQGNLYTDFNTNSPVSGDITKASKGGYDIGYFKFDANLNLIGQGRVGGNGDDKSKGIIKSASGTFVSAVDTTSTDLPKSILNSGTGDSIAIFETDQSFNLLGGGRFGATGGSKNTTRVSGLQLSPSGDLIIAGTTWETTGDFTGNGLPTNDRIGYAFNVDPISYEVKNKIYYGGEVYGFNFLSNGDYYILAAASNNNNNNLGNITGTFRTPANSTALDGNFDFVYSKFGPTANTNALINARTYVTVLKGDEVNIQKEFNASIGDYDEYVDQSNLVINPTSILTTEIKSYPIAFSGKDAATKTSYVNVTANPDPTVKGVQVFDSAKEIRILIGSNLTAEKMTTHAKIKAWNMTDNSIYTHTIDTTDLAAVNAATTSITVPVKVTITEVTRANLTRITNVILMTKAEMEALIKAEAEAKWGPDQTELAKIAVQVVGLGIKNADEIINEISTNTGTAQKYKEDLDKLTVNVDTDGDGTADYNIDIDGDGTADVNKDTNRDGTPNENLVQTTDPKGNNYDKDGDGYPDTNTDKDGDGKPDLNVDYEGDGIADFNKDANRDGVVDVPNGNAIQTTDPKAPNYDKDGDGKPDNNIDKDGDGKPELNIDYDGNGTADHNKDANKDGVVDTPNGNAIQTNDPNGLNYDKDGDGKADTNVDIDGDKKPDVNIDYDGDGIADFNKDANKDGVVDTPNGNTIQTTDPKAPNYDKDGDGKADNNIDKDGDGKIDFNLDIDGDGTADINKDANKDAVVDTPDGNPTQNTDPKGNNYDKDDDGYPDLNTDVNGDKKPDLNIDYDGNGTADHNKDANKDGVVDTPNGNAIQTNDPNGLNYDKDGDGKADTNVDIDGDKKPDVNIDYDGDGIADFNKDANKDGVVDTPNGNAIQTTDPKAPNYDKDGDGKADNNIDKDGDGKIDFNLDIDGDGTADINKDANKDAVVDTPDGNPTQNTDPNGNNYDKDDDGYPDLNTDIDGDKKPDLNIDTDKDGKPNLNIDADKDGKAELNIDTDGNGKPNVNIDIDGNGTADVNKDTNGDGKADANKTQTTDPNGNNYDKDGDEYPETNIDIDDDGKPDLNIDYDGDGIADHNKDADGDGKVDKPGGNEVQNKDPYAPNYDKDGDGKADNNIDKDGDGKIDFNLDIDGDGTADVNKDADKDGVVDVPGGNPTQNKDPEGNNYDKDGDGYPELNVDIDGDKKPDLNIDTDKDGKPNLNIDADKDGKPELNVDTDGNGKANVNIDIDGNGTADINKDTNGDGKADTNKTQTTDPKAPNYDEDGDEYPDTNIDIDGDGKIDLNRDIDGDKKPDLNIDTDGDGKADKNIDANNNGIIDSVEDAANKLPNTGNDTVAIISVLITLSGVLYIQRFKSDV